MPEPLDPGSHIILFLRWFPFLAKDVGGGHERTLGVQLLCVHASFQLTSLILPAIPEPPGIPGWIDSLLIGSLCALLFISQMCIKIPCVQKIPLLFFCPYEFILSLSLYYHRERSLEKERGGKCVEWMSWACSGLYFSDFVWFLKTTLSHLQAFSFLSIGILNSL